MAKSIHAGHRNRARQEFLTRGLNGLADHRVLELLLFYAIPRGDVNPLAHALIDRFGSLTGVFHATYEQLLSVDGIGPNAAALMKLVPAVSARYLEQNARVTDCIVDTWQVKHLLAPMFFGARNEKFCLICMDAKNKLLNCMELGEGIHNSVVITSRKILEAVLGCNASRVILAHNHLSGVAMYSAADIAATRNALQLLAQVGVELADHVVFANDEMVSMRDSGVFDRLEDQE